MVARYRQLTVNWSHDAGERTPMSARGDKPSGAAVFSD